jgi:hypothetical protein
MTVTSIIMGSIERPASRLPSSSLTSRMTTSKRPAADASVSALARATSSGSGSHVAAERGSTPSGRASSHALSLSDDAQSCGIVLLRLRRQWS